jgi:hypothetical protein
MTLPAGPGPARDQYILDAATSGAMTFSWATVTSTIPGHTGKFSVFATPAKVDGLYVGVGARVLQQVADMLGCSLLTPRLQDLMYQQAPTKILPWLDYDPSRMQTTQWFQRSTAGITNLLAKAGWDGSSLAMGIGKPWQLDNDLLLHPGMAENYGLYVPRSALQGGKYFGVNVEPTVSLPEIGVLQGRGWAHTLGQDDYSELISLVSRQCEVDGQLRDFSDVVRDPAVCALVSHQGPLKIVRQPGVPIVACKVPLGLTGIGPIGLSYGEDGTITCPVQLTGLPSEAASSGDLGLKLVGVVLAAAAVYTGWQWYRHG